MHVLVLGAYGLIGQEIARELLARGHRVTGLARSAATGRALLPALGWIGADLARLTAPAAWSPHLAGIDAVINASGALQSGPRDNLARAQRDAIVALVAAAEARGIGKLVQISAPGAHPAARTEFLRTKGEADAALAASRLDWTILKPCLVVAPTAYGGTSLLRMLAAFPLVQPLTAGRSLVQTVAVIDVARAACRALADSALSRRTFDLAEPEPQTLRDVVLAFRRWLGFARPVRVVDLPRALGHGLARIADAAGLLGWRSPLRTTALRVIEDGVTADPGPWRAATGETLAALPETLARMPATRQERAFARMELAFPLLVVAFALFWIVSGVIGLLQRAPAAALLAAATGPGTARTAVLLGSLADVAIGAALLVRPLLRPACLAAAALSLAYLAGGTLLTPALWSDPLGPLVKIVPVIALALALAAHAEDR